MRKQSHKINRYPQSFTKSEIVRVHMTLFYLKTLFESVGYSNNFFHEYNSLKIYPTHIHLEKHRHVIAVNYLVKGILSTLNINPDQILTTIHHNNKNNKR
jgi:hypothetical protein